MVTLTEQELEGLHRTWKLVAADKKGNGVYIFMTFFSVYPEYKKLFKRLRDIPDDQLEKHPAMRAHATTVLDALGVFIENLDETDTLVELIHANVENHFRRNLTSQHYEHVLAVILSCLQSKLGAELDTDATNGWTKLIDTMQEIVNAKLSELQKEEPKQQQIIIDANSHRQKSMAMKQETGKSGNKMAIGVCAGLAVALGAAFIVKNRQS